MHDSLPHSDQDPVLTLYAHYFLAAELMRSHYVMLRYKLEQRGYLNQDQAVEQSVYFYTWLGFLAVTCEGFKKLRLHLLLREERPTDFLELLPKSGALGRKINEHAGLLRTLRNDIFHLRDDTESIKSFSDHGVQRLIWAEELQNAFKEFFSQYRILCEVHCALNGRQSELQMGRSRTAPVRYP